MNFRGRIKGRFLFRNPYNAINGDGLTRLLKTERRLKQCVELRFYVKRATTTADERNVQSLVSFLRSPCNAFNEGVETWLRK